MTAVLTRLTAVLVAAFALLVGGAHLIPESEPDLSAFHQLFYDSSGCAGSCLLGIRPGMALDEALRILRSSRWIEGVASPDIVREVVSVTWNWSGQQPEVIDASVPGFLYASATSTHHEHVVANLVIRTHLRLYDLQHALGQTDKGGASSWLTNRHITYNVTYYDASADVSTNLSASLLCPARLMAYVWFSHTEISQQSGLSPYDYIPPEWLPGRCGAARINYSG